MATAESSRKLSFTSEVGKNLLKCGICLNEYKNPRLLTCSHTFCLECLRQSTGRNKKNIKCALCRKETKIPRGGITSLGKNLTVAGLLDLVAANKRDKIASNLERVVEVSTTKVKPKTAATKASKGSSKKETANKKAAGKAGAKKGPNVPPKTSKASHPSELKAKMTEKAKKAAAAAAKSGRKPPVIARDRNDNESVEFSEEFTPTDDSSDYTSSDSDSYTGSSGDEDDNDESSSYTDDDSSDVFSTSDESEYSDDESVPPTPSVQIWDGITVDEQVFVFGSGNKITNGVVRVIEPLNNTTFCGVELETPCKGMNCKEIKKMKDSYLKYWMTANDFPCIVVRIDQCCPLALVEALQNQ